MKVCTVSKHYPPYAGGLENRVMGISEWLAGRGHTVTVLTSWEKGTVASETRNGVEVCRFRTVLNLFNAPFTPLIFIKLLSLDYDVADVNLPDPMNSIFVWAASVLRGKPYTVTYHADIVKDRWFHLPFKVLYGLFLSLILGAAARIIVTSPDYADSSPSLSRFRGKVVVAPSFIDPRVFNPLADGSRIKARHDIRGKKVVLFVGRLVPYKGVEYLLAAFNILKTEEASLVIVGEGPLDGELKEKASSLGLKNVVFAGAVPGEDLPGYYAACDVFVLPSVTRQEAFGLVLAEAMACGKPVISTNFSGMPYVVGDGGVLVAPKDPEALAGALDKVLGDDRLAYHLSTKGLSRVGELFSRDVVCAKIEEIYKLTVQRS
jgi:glycosyltransferase involved in cell wall biosynthesis